MHPIPFAFTSGNMFALLGWCLEISKARSIPQLSVLLLTCLPADGSLSVGLIPSRRQEQLPPICPVYRESLLEDFQSSACALIPKTN